MLLLTNTGLPWGRALGPMAVKITNAKKYEEPLFTGHFFQVMS